MQAGITGALQIVNNYPILGLYATNSSGPQAADLKIQLRPATNAQIKCIKYSCIRGILMDNEPKKDLIAGCCYQYKRKQCFQKKDMHVSRETCG